MARLVKKKLHDKFILDFSNLTYPTSGKKIFNEVKKVYIKLPENMPSCQISPSAPLVSELGLDYDERAYGFTSVVSQLFENNLTQAEAEERMDRLSNIEDVILDYLQEIPNAAEAVVPGAAVHRIQVTGARYSVEEDEKGIVLMQLIDFTATILVYVKDND